jgi:purine-cytosine permease-like protein
MTGNPKDLSVEIPPLITSLKDDERALKEAAVDDFAGHVVPPTWRSSRGSLVMAWFSVCSAMFWIVFAGTMSLLVGTRDSVIGMVLAAVVISAVSFFVSRYAARTGISLGMFSRRILGFWGGAFGSLVIGVTMIYYISFEASIIAVAFHEYLGLVPLEVWYLLSVLMGILLAIGGVRTWMDKFNGWLLPVYIVGILGAVVWAVAEYGYDPGWLTYVPDPLPEVSGPGWVVSFSGYLSQLVLVMSLWDFARMGRDKDRKFHGLFTFGLPFWIPTFVVNGLIGIFVAQTIALDGPLTDSSAVLALVALMGIWGVLLVWVSQSRINTANFYVSSVNLQSFGGRMFNIALPRTAWVVIIGAIVYVLMLTDVVSFILAAMNYQGVFIVGWVSIATVHILTEKPAQGVSCVEFRPGRLQRINHPGFTAWLAAAALGLGLLIFGGGFGETWTLPIVFVVSGGLYHLLNKANFGRSTLLIRPHDPRDEVEDPLEVRIKCRRCDKSYLAVEIDRDPSNEHQPICSLCAERSSAFYKAALAEALRVRLGRDHGDRDHDVESSFG